jgi:hypothetical protein
MHSFWRVFWWILGVFYDVCLVVMYSLLLLEVVQEVVCKQLTAEHNFLYDFEMQCVNEDKNFVLLF